MPSHLYPVHYYTNATKHCKGTSVLVVQNLLENLWALFWYKRAFMFQYFEVSWCIRATNSSVWGPPHSGRECHLNDSGFYTLLILTTDLTAGVRHVERLVDRTGKDSLWPFCAMYGLDTQHCLEWPGHSVLMLVFGALSAGHTCWRQIFTGNTPTSDSSCRFLCKETQTKMSDFIQFHGGDVNVHFNNKDPDWGSHGIQTERWAPGVPDHTSLS